MFDRFISGFAAEIMSLGIKKVINEFTNKCPLQYEFVLPELIPPDL